MAHASTLIPADPWDNEYYHELLNKGRHKLNKKKEKRQSSNHSLKLRSIKPRTHAQHEAFECYYNDHNLVLHGCAGTGKTFLSLYLALEELLGPNEDHKQSITIFRSVVPTRDMGFLPGNEKEKAKAYEAPYKQIVNDLFGRGDAYEVLKSKKMLNFETTSFLRGMTFDDSILIVDECQNLTFHELDSLITRVGVNSKILFSGDYGQNDFNNPKKECSGLLDFMRILKGMNQFDTVTFKEDDIVRSGLVKDYIISKIKHGL